MLIAGKVHTSISMDLTCHTSNHHLLW